MRGFWVALAVASLLTSCAPTQRSADSATLVPSPPPNASTAHCPLLCPRGAPASHVVIQRDVYTLSYNSEYKVATWVAYSVWPGSIRQGARSDNYRGDPDIPNDMELQNDEYAGVGSAGYHRGHQAPDASLDGADPDRTIDYTTNLTPQNGHLNSGIWAALEQAERDLLKKGIDRIASVTGPYFAADAANDPKVTLNTEKRYRVPTGYWKVIFYQTGSTSYAFTAFMMPQDTNDDSFCEHVASIDGIEEATGLNIFPIFSEYMADKIESIKRPGPATLSLMGCPSS